MKESKQREVEACQLVWTLCHANLIEPPVSTPAEYIPEYVPEVKTQNVYSDVIRCGFVTLIFGLILKMCLRNRYQ